MKWSIALAGRQHSSVDLRHDQHRLEMLCKKLTMTEHFSTTTFSTVLCAAELETITTSCWCSKKVRALFPADSQWFLTKENISHCFWHFSWSFSFNLRGAGMHCGFCLVSNRLSSTLLHKFIISGCNQLSYAEPFLEFFFKLQITKNKIFTLVGWALFAEHMTCFYALSASHFRGIAFCFLALFSSKMMSFDWTSSTAVLLMEVSWLQETRRS